MTTGSGETTKYEYGINDRLSKLTYADGKSVSYEYDKNDNLTKVTDRTGTVTTYVYDAINRVTEIHRPNGVSTYNTYNARGQIVTMKNICDGCGWVISQYDYTYDDRGFITGETAVESLYGYAWDDKHDGKHENGRHDGQYPHGGQHTNKHAKDGEYNFQIVETTRAFTYDDDGRLLTATENEENQGRYDYVFEYDGMGNRTYYGKSRNGVLQESGEYTYNLSNQLVEAKIYDGKKHTTLTYGYDADGNRISETGWVGTGKVENTYIYTVENRLKAVYDADELLVAMAYDGDGNRIFQLNYNLHTDDDWKGNSGNGNGNNKDNTGSAGQSLWGAVAEFFTGGGDETAADASDTEAAGESMATGNTTNTGGSTDQSGILFPMDGEVSGLEQEMIDMIKTTGKHKNYELVEYVNDVNRDYTEVLMELNINGIMDTAYSYGNERLTVERFDGWTGFYTYDPRGSVSGVTGMEGYIWQSYRYDAFGGITFGKPQYNNVYGYNAESYNPNLDGQYLRARYYNPTTADFFTEDPYLGNLTDPLTLNRYSYAKSSPLNYMDPSGHSATIIGGLIVLAGLILSGCSNSDDVIETIEMESSITEIQIKIETQASLEESMTSAKESSVVDSCENITIVAKSMSDRGLELLAYIELNPNVFPYLYTEDGGIYPHYVHDGGITFGYGHIVTAGDYQNDPIDKALYDKYIRVGTPFDDGKSIEYKPEVVPNSQPMSSDDALLLLKKDVSLHEEKINNFFYYGEDEEYKELTQNQYDALVIHRHLRGSLTNKMREMVLEDWSKEEWEKELLDEGSNHYNRYKSEIELYFNGDYDWYRNN